jgi:hypothetical protein
VRNKFHRFPRLPHTRVCGTIRRTLRNRTRNDNQLGFYKT